MRAAVVGIYVLGLVAGCSSWSCGSSNSNRADPRAQQRENERIRADADAAHKSLQDEEDRRDDQESAEPNHR